MNVWTFENLADTTPTPWPFPVNPNTMDPPELPGITVAPLPMAVFGRRFGSTHQIEPHAELVVIQQPTAPLDWSFSGVIYTLEDMLAMHWWVESTTRIRLTDHKRRKWLIQLTDFEEVRAQSHRWRERHTYTMHCLMLGSLS